MRTLRILILSHRFYPAIGGIETLTDILARHFTEAGHTVHVLTWSAASDDRKSFPFVVIRKPTTAMLLREHAWANVVLENNICLRLSWPNLFIKRPIITGLQTWIVPSPTAAGIATRLKFQWLKRVNTVVACSEIIREACWKSSIVITNPYDDTMFRQLPNITRDKDYVFLGRLVSDKGVDIALRAFALLPDNPVRLLTIIGDGPERNALQTLAEELGIAANVTFMGSLTGERLVRCLNEHRYLLVPSVWREPYGIVALEGMACGCVPIVSDGGGLPEAVGRAGLISQRGNVQELARCMLELATTPQLVNSLQSAAQSHLLTHRKGMVANQYKALLEDAFVS